MKCIARTSQLSLVVIVFLFIASSRADEVKQVERPKTIDPSGTWRWEHQAGDRTVKDVLKLNYDGKKVTGTYQGSRDAVEIKNGKMEGEKLSFDFGLEFNGRMIDIQFEGKITGDNVDGTVSMKADGDSREFPWSAKRSVEASDVVGTWNMHIETSNGTTLTPKLTLSQEGEKKELQGTYESSSTDTEIGVTEIELKDNQLSFTISGTFNGNTLTAKYSVQPRGDKLSGKIDFQFNDRTGEMKVTGKRENKE